MSLAGRSSSEKTRMDALFCAPASKPDQHLGEEVCGEHSWASPRRGTLRTPRWKRDSCGVRFIANIKGKKSRQIVSDAINIFFQISSTRARSAPIRGRRATAPCNSCADSARLLRGARPARSSFRYRSPATNGRRSGAHVHPRKLRGASHHEASIADQIGRPIFSARLRDVPDRQFLALRTPSSRPSPPHAGVSSAGRVDHPQERRRFERRL